jgi:hypothetical protein
MTSNLEAVEAACDAVATAGHDITFTTIAEHTGISRTTLYRNPELRAVIEHRRTHSHDPRSLTGMAREITHLRTALEAIADRVRRQEERLRSLESRQPRPKTS